MRSVAKEAIGRLRTANKNLAFDDDDNDRETIVLETQQSGLTDCHAARRHDRSWALFRSSLRPPPTVRCRTPACAVSLRIRAVQMLHFSRTSVANMLCARHKCDMPTRRAPRLVYGGGRREHGMPRLLSFFGSQYCSASPSLCMPHRLFVCVLLRGMSRRSAAVSLEDPFSGWTRGGATPPRMPHAVRKVNANRSPVLLHHARAPEVGVGDVMIVVHTAASR